MLCVVPPVSLGAVSVLESHHLPADSLEQVFYGRYLRKLSNLTQEAIGEMSKVSSSALELLGDIESTSSDGRGEAQRLQDRRSIQFTTPRDPPLLETGRCSFQSCEEGGVYDRNVLGSDGSYRKPCDALPPWLWWVLCSLVGILLTKFRGTPCVEWRYHGRGPDLAANV